MSRDAAARSSGELVAALDEVLQALQDQPGSDDAVHTARKAIKRARAALRLLRDPLGEETFKRENTVLRDAGRCLAPVRDARSLVDACQAFRKRHSNLLQGEAYDALTTQLQARLDNQRHELQRTGAILQKCMALTTTCNEHLSQRHIDSAHTVERGLERIFHKGRKTRAGAKKDGSPRALHEWRKQVKYLSNALKVLDDPSPALRKIAKRSDKLADRLGEDHDLAELVSCLADPQLAISVDEQRHLLSLIERRRARLQKKAHAIGSKIYRRKPRYFVSKLVTSTGTAKAMQSAPKPAFAK